MTNTLRVALRQLSGSRTATPRRRASVRKRPFLSGTQFCTCKSHQPESVKKGSKRPSATACLSNPILQAQVDGSEPFVAHAACAEFCTEGRNADLRCVSFQCLRSGANPTFAATAKSDTLKGQRRHEGRKADFRRSQHQRLVSGTKLPFTPEHGTAGFIQIHYKRL